MAAVRALGDERLDPSEAMVRDAAWSRAVETATGWVEHQHPSLFVEQLVEGAADTSEGRLMVALIALGMVHDAPGDVEERDDEDALFALTSFVTQHWSCSQHESVPLAAAHGCATTSEARRARPPAWCRNQVWWQVPGSLDSVGGLECSERASPSPSCTDLVERALARHQEGTRLRSHSVEERDPELLRLAHERFAAAAVSYRDYLDRCPGFGDLDDTYTLTYNLADALFWSESYEEAASASERVRDWSWHEGRLLHGAEYAAEAARRVVEARLRLLDAAVARGELALPALASSPTPQPVPDLVAHLILAREIYVARVVDDAEHVRTLYLLANAELLERYGYWDEARTRAATVIEAGDDLADEARAAIVRMATALGDATELHRVMP